MKKILFLCLTAMALLTVSCAFAAGSGEAYGDMLRADLYLFEGENASIRVPIVTRMPVKQASYDMWYNQDGEPADTAVKEDIFIDGEHVETEDGWYAYDLYLHFTMGKKTESISRIAVKIDGELYDLYPEKVDLNLISIPDEPKLLRMDQTLTIPDRETIPFQCNLYADEMCEIKAIRFSAGQTVKELKINDVVCPNPERLSVKIPKDCQATVEVVLEVPQEGKDYGSTFFQMETTYQPVKDGTKEKLYSHSVSLTSFEYDDRLQELKEYIENKSET